MFAEYAGYVAEQLGDRTVEDEHLTVSAADHPKPQSRAWRLWDPLALGIALP